jgi:hypothetical protein
VSAVGILVQPFRLILSAYPFCQGFTLSEGNIGNRGSLHQLIEIDHAPTAFLPKCVVKLRMHPRPLTGYVIPYNGYGVWLCLLVTAFVFTITATVSF